MDEPKQGKRTGRPPKYPPGKRPTLTFRVQEPLHERLRTDAAAAGRSISEEVERRVELSFEYEKRFGELRAHLEEQRAKIAAMTEESAVDFLRRAGWPRLVGTRYGTALLEPGSIAHVGDGRVGRVKRVPFPPGGFIVEPDPELGMVQAPAATEEHEQAPSPAMPPAPAPPHDWEDLIYRAIRRAMRDEREQDLTAEDTPS